MGIPASLQTKQENLELRLEEEGRKASKASHAGIIRIGF